MLQRHQHCQSNLQFHAGCPQPTANTEKVQRKEMLCFPFSFPANHLIVQSSPSFAADALQTFSSCFHHGKPVAWQSVHANLPTQASVKCTNTPGKITLYALVKGRHHCTAQPHQTSPPSLWPQQLQLSKARFPSHICPSAWI